MNIITLVLIAAVIPQFVVEDAVDLIEVNHFYDDDGQPVCDQLIFWEWSNEKCWYTVRAWRLLKKPSQVPRRRHASRDYSAIWQDGHVLRRVRARRVRETWTQHDPELQDRTVVPRQLRAGLLRPKQ